MDSSATASPDTYPPRGWASERVYDSARQHYDSMLQGIDSALSRIDLAVYIFELDEIGEMFVQRLRQAAQRGVRVRVLVDGVGSARSAFALGERLTGVGAEFHIYHPLPWYWDDYRWSLREGSWIQKFWFFLNTVNRRDHRKFMVVDGCRAWCGNFNLCVDHIGDSPPWRDYGVRVEGGEVADLVKHFEQVWTDCEEGEIVINPELSCSNESMRTRWRRNRRLARTIREARHRVWICNAYFSPSPSILRAIRAAGKKNIDIRLIVAGRSDVPLFPLLTSTYYADLLKMGASVYQYDRGILHAKVVLVDDRCIIGSTNMNHRSFYHDLELDVILSHRESVESMEEWLRRDMKLSRRIGRADVSPLSRSFWLGWLPRLLRYWM